MQRKKKVCSECGEEAYLYARKRCLSCDRKLSPEKHGLQTKPNKAPQGTDSSGKGKCTIIKRKSRISPVSKSMTKKLAEYRVVRDEYMKYNDVCEICGTSRNLTLHHKAGRGKYLCDITTFATLCITCHERVHREDKWSRENGWLWGRL